MSALIGFFAGSFDPPTRGHIDVIERASTLCAQLYVGVTQNPAKNDTLFSAEERVTLLREVVSELPGVEVIAFEGLAVDAAQECGATCLIRGIRSASDADYEFRMAVANRKVSGLDTFFLMTNERYSHISSTLIRELGSKELTAFVPDKLEARIRAELNR